MTSVLAGLSFAGMVALGAPDRDSQDAALAESKTIMATYRVVAGKEVEFEQVLARKWEVYTKEKLVYDHPHVVVRGKEADGKAYFVDIFTWVRRGTPDHAPASVIAVWQIMDSLVEARNGHPNREITEVQLVAPKN